MKHFFLLIFFTGIFWVHSQNTALIKRLDGSTISQDSLTSAIKYLMNKADVKGLAITVFNSKKPVYMNTFGFSDVENNKKLDLHTNLYGASFSKAVFAVVVMKLVDEGVISLDKPLQSYLPKPIYEYEPKVWHEDFKELKDYPEYTKITARMCLDHTTGLPNWRWFESDEKLRIKFEPGSRYSYSGEGLTYLQVVLEKITGKPLEELAQERVFKPLGMTASSYKWQEKFEKDYAYGYDEEGKKQEKDKDNAPRGAGTLETTIEDYSKFLSAILNKKILSSKSYKELFSPQIRIHSKNQFGPGALEDGNWYDNLELSYGLGWGLVKSPYGPGAFKEGQGSGFQNYSIVFPDKGIGMLIMSNSYSTGKIIKYLLETGIQDKYTPWEWDQYIPYDKVIK
ncbi:serine hydrolase domain-containing protein [Flavobacterium johnsoniae]|uniref:CubicO group peptidase, beta-lactamase class C family n=1 Tax=Flavobacterium johnsoniae TaxID=986 RepID=A0A1M5TYA2_FLAJO|nr:serine hydrolase domain-containing protein [Flavobacterium johnsoniae]SHH55658.1 CubicO group peptidase, beta-lactamase class C family [Flavobacterium johnsoniae]